MNRSRSLGIFARCSLALCVLVASACGPAKTGPAPAPTGQLTADSGCRQSTNCKKWGWCAVQGDQCVASADADCRASEVCKNGGLCSLRNGQCVALTNDDCSDSAWCDKFGWCTASQNVCIR